MVPRTVLVTLAIVMALAGAPAMCAVAPAPPVPEAPGERGDAQPDVSAGPMCVVAGTVYCTEYGSRHPEQLRLVFADEDELFGSEISDTNGSFAVPVPCGRTYELRVEFAGKAMPVGRIDVPEAEAGTVFSLEIRHIGSYLELVRDVRNGIYEDDIIYRLVWPEQ